MFKRPKRKESYEFSNNNYMEQQLPESQLTDEEITQKTEDTTQKPVKKRRNRRKPELNHKELSILDFLLKGTFTRASNGATVEEIAKGVSEAHRNSLRNAGCLDEEEESKPLLGTRQAYRLVGALVEKKFIDYALKQDRLSTFYILPHGVKAYTKHIDLTQEEFIDFAQAMQPLQANWAGEMEKLVKQVFPD